MPKIRRAKLPEVLLAHLLTRARQRNISEEQVIQLAGQTHLNNLG